MKLKHFGLLALLLVGLCGCEEDVSEPTSFDSILNSDSKDNVIYYVTTDNRPLEVDESDFNAPIFKHEYHKDNGYGEIVFMADVTIIGDSAFRDYNTDSPKLKRIKIPDTVTEIGDYAFYYCANLTSLEIPDSVTEIGERAFYMCDSLTSITIPDSVTSIGENAFEHCGIINVTISDSVVEIGKGAFNNCHSLTSLTIGDGITSIGEEVFYGCSSLTSLTIPYGVTEIGSGAFGSCSSLTNIHLPDSVTNIGEIAFAWCENLTTVTIPNSVTSIGQQAFYGCSRLASVYCTPITPPSGSRWMFDDNDIGRKIYVPTASVKAYKTASYWKDYADDIVPEGNYYSNLSKDYSFKISGSNAYGYAIFWGDRFDYDCNIYVIHLYEDIESLTGLYIGMVVLTNKTATDIVGTYTPFITSNGYEYTFFEGYVEDDQMYNSWIATMEDGYVSSGPCAPLKLGSVTIAATSKAGVYTVTLNCTDDLGYEINGTFTSKIEFFDETSSYAAPMKIQNKVMCIKCDY